MHVEQLFTASLMSSFILNQCSESLANSLVFLIPIWFVMKRSGVYITRKMTVHDCTGSCEEITDTSEAIEYWNAVTRRYMN